MLELIDIHTYYGESHVLQGISLKVDSGSVVGLLGRNGMGKTTAIHSIIGIIRPREGSMIFNGKNLNNLKSYKIPQAGIALVPQGRRIFPSLSVKENLTMAERGGNKDKGWSLDRVYALFPILKERANIKGNLLSGGEQQMLAIGRALMTNPDLILMDEPSEGLAPLVINELANIIKQLNNEGLSILLVEQNLHLALTVTDYAYIMNKGKIVYESEIANLINNEAIQNQYLGVDGA